jgi:hypothetical protein
MSSPLKQVQQWQESIEHAKVETLRYDTVSTTTTTTSTRTSMKRENSIGMEDRYTSKTYEVLVSSDITDFEKSTVGHMSTMSTTSFHTSIPPYTKRYKHVRVVPSTRTTKSIREIVRSFWAPVTTRKPRVSRHTVRSTRYDTTSMITSAMTPFPTYYCLTRTMY